LNNLILYLLICGEKNQVAPMVSRFLLHYPSDMSVGGISGKGKLSIWGRVLEWHHHFKGALHFGKPPELKRSAPKFWPLSSGDPSKGAQPVHSWAENGGKSLPCQGIFAVV
jgi:hypothetical protein